MNKIKFFIAGFCFVILTSFTSDNLPKKFTDLLEKAEMTFDQPSEYSQTQPIENLQMNYDYALINDAKDFEIRYAIKPLDEMLKNYNEREKNKKSGDMNINPNKLYAAFFQAIVFNVSGGKMAKISEFNPEEVKKEFNADRGAITMVEVGKEFGQNYKYCFLVTIHKDDVGDAYCFYLSNTKEGIAKNMQASFHSLRFK
jgi:hypothetical protein